LDATRGAATGAGRVDEAEAAAPAGAARGSCDDAEALFAGEGAAREAGRGAVPSTAVGARGAEEAGGAGAVRERADGVPPPLRDAPTAAEGGGGACRAGGPGARRDI